MAIDKEKVRHSIFDVVPKSAQSVKKKETEAATGATPQDPAQTGVQTPAEAAVQTPSQPQARIPADLTLAPAHVPGQAPVVAVAPTPDTSPIARPSITQAPSPASATGAPPALPPTLTPTLPLTPPVTPPLAPTLTSPLTPPLAPSLTSPPTPPLTPTLTPPLTLTPSATPTPTPTRPKPVAEQGRPLTQASSGKAPLMPVPGPRPVSTASQSHVSSGRGPSPAAEVASGVPPVHAGQAEAGGGATSHPAAKPAFLDGEMARLQVHTTPPWFRAIIGNYCRGRFFEQIKEHFIVCKTCQGKLTQAGDQVRCAVCDLAASERELAVAVLRQIGEELYATTRLERDLRWLTDSRIEWRGLPPKKVTEDLRHVLGEAYGSVFAHELVKALIQKSPDTVADFFRKYIDRIEIGREGVRIRLK